MTERVIPEGMVLLTTPSFVADQPDHEIWMTEAEYEEHQRIAKEAQALFEFAELTGYVNVMERYYAQPR